MTGASKSLAEATLAPFERLRHRLDLAAQGEPSAEPARCVAAARMFAAAVSSRLAAHADAAASRAAAAPEDGAAAASAGYLAASRAAWQLCHTVFVEPGDGTGVVSGALVDWFRENAAALGSGERGVPERLRLLLTDVAAVARENAESDATLGSAFESNDESEKNRPVLQTRKPEDARGYWSCFCALVALGWTDAAADLAHLHSCWDEWRMGKKSAEPHAELLEAVVALLRCAPRLETVDEADLVEEEAFGEDVFSISRSGSDHDRDRELFGGRASRRGERSAVFPEDGGFFEGGQDRSGTDPDRDPNVRSNAGGSGFVATSAPQLAAFREAWTRQVRRVLDDAALFDRCPDTHLAEGARLALRAMAGEETAVARAVGDDSTWLELFVAEARCRFTSLRPSGDCAALARRCVAARGPGASPEMDHLLIAILEADAAAVASACSKHLDAWFLANVAELLVAAAGGESWADSAFSGAALRRPVATLRGASQAELHLVEYGSALATRRSTREGAMRVFPRCHTRGAGACDAVARAADHPPGAAYDFPNFVTTESRKDAEARVAFETAERALVMCAAAGLPASAHAGVAWRASASARRRGDAHAAAAWAHRAGSVPGASRVQNHSGVSVAALALAQLPDAAAAARHPAAAAAALARLAGDHPSVNVNGRVHDHARARRDDIRYTINTINTIGMTHRDEYDGGAAAFLDALASFRASLAQLARVGSGENAARAAAAVTSPAAVAAAHRTGDAFVALLRNDHSSCEAAAHLWRECAFAAIPLLEGETRALSASAAELAMARLEQARFAAADDADRSALEADAADRGTHTPADAREQAARLALAREYARACVAG